MNIKEYEIVKDFSYLQYCDYLQEKYGIGLCNYMTKSWNKNPKISRSKDGLFVHHKYEDHAILLSNKNAAMRNPFEWQLAENMVYCDYLEHLFLHILICENPANDKNKFEAVGIGGVFIIVSTLNDFYSGWNTEKLLWMQTCLNKVCKDKDVYLTLLKRFKNNCGKHPKFTDDCLFRSCNAQLGTWEYENNRALFEEIANL